VKKFDRQGAILRIVQERRLSTQEEVAEALRERGLDAVQATISRDIAQLGLVKVRADDGRLVYAQPGLPDAERHRILAAAFARWALTCESNGHLVVIRTPPGHANALGQAIDQARLPEVIGTVAGDNTIMVIAREGVTGAAIEQQLRHHLEGDT